jgi:TRAP-type mannitol/chloroaromatic compound transport system permease small subunit
LRADQTESLLDRISSITGKAAAWLTLFMVIVTFIVVIMRYVFDAGLIWMQESVVWMHAVVFMLGEEHVRVDIFYRTMSERRRAWVDLIGVIVFLMPLCTFLAWASFDFVTQSWSIGESSRESGGLPYPFVPLLKSVQLLMPIAVSLQGLSLLVRSVKTLRGG